MSELVKEILKIGLIPALLLVVIYLIVQDPDRAVKLKAIITQPFFKAWKWFSKEHISSKVSSSVNEYFKRDLYSSLVNSDKYNFKVKWHIDLKNERRKRSNKKYFICCAYCFTSCYLSTYKKEYQSKYC